MTYLFLIVGLRLCDWILALEKLGDKAGNPIIGYFFDKKEAHYVVTRVRRNQRVQEVYSDGTLKCAGFTPLEVDESLKKARAAAEAAKNAGLQLSVLRAVQRGDVPHLIIPSEGSLSFAVDESLKRELEQAARDFPPPPAAKKPRVGEMATQPSVAKNLTFDQVKEKYTILKYEKITLGSPAVELRVLRLEHKVSGLVYHFFHNVENHAKTVKANAWAFSASAGKFVNVLSDAGNIRDGAIQWKWDCGIKSVFCHSFGGADDSICAFSEMFTAARKDAGGKNMTLYGHNLVDSAARTGMSRTVTPHRRRTADIVFQTVATSESAWKVETMGDHFQAHEVDDVDPLLQHAWRVRLEAGVASIACSNLMGC